jgi:hypothetical protein
VEGPPITLRIMEVHFRTDGAQLLGLWTAIRLLGETRGIVEQKDPGRVLDKGAEYS